MQLSFAQLPRRRRVGADLGPVFEFVAPKIREAAIQVDAQLSALGVRHVLVGGLAVGAHVRATRVVDFLVGEEAFEL